MLNSVNTAFPPCRCCQSNLCLMTSVNDSKSDQGMLLGMRRTLQETEFKLFWQYAAISIVAVAATREVKIRYRHYAQGVGRGRRGFMQEEPSHFPCHNTSELLLEILHETAARASSRRTKLRRTSSPHPLHLVPKRHRSF